MLEEANKDLRCEIRSLIATVKGLQEVINSTVSLKRKRDDCETIDSDVITPLGGINSTVSSQSSSAIGSNVTTNSEMDTIVNTPTSIVPSKNFYALFSAEKPRGADVLVVEGSMLLSEYIVKSKVDGAGRVRGGIQVRIYSSRIYSSYHFFIDKVR